MGTTNTGNTSNTGNTVRVWSAVDDNGNVMHTVTASSENEARQRMAQAWARGPQMRQMGEQWQQAGAQMTSEDSMTWQVTPR